MDSVTQIALGAAVGEATLGRQIGNRAMLWGAICGTLPDLDVFVPLGDAVKDFTCHRSFSHSIFVLALLTPPIVWLIIKIHPQTAENRRRWLLLVYLTFLTHVLLDSFTVYGTQLFWPFSNYPVSGSAIFIIDPVYTLPLLVGVLAALVMSRQSHRGHALNNVGLVLSSAYLAWFLVAKMHIENVARASLQAQGIEYQRLLTTPAPFNSLLWRALAMDVDGYYEGFRSVLDNNNDIRFVHYPSDSTLLRGLESHWPVQRLQWFSYGFYSVEAEEDAVVISDLRMGLEPDYVFRFKVAEIGNPHPVAADSEQIFSEWDLSRLNWLWKRIWSEHAQ